MRTSSLIPSVFRTTVIAVLSLVALHAEAAERLTMTTVYSPSSTVRLQAGGREESLRKATQLPDGPFSISTAAGDLVQIQFPDGTWVRVAPNSSVEFVPQANEITIYGGTALLSFSPNSRLRVRQMDIIGQDALVLATSDVRGSRVLPLQGDITFLGRDVEAGHLAVGRPNGQVEDLGRTDLDKFRRESPILVDLPGSPRISAGPPSSPHQLTGVIESLQAAKRRAEELARRDTEVGPFFGTIISDRQGAMVDIVSDSLGRSLNHGSTFNPQTDVTQAKQQVQHAAERLSNQLAAEQFQRQQDYLRDLATYGRAISLNVGTLWSIDVGGNFVDNVSGQTILSPTSFTGGQAVYKVKYMEINTAPTAIAVPVSAFSFTATQKNNAGQSFLSTAFFDANLGGVADFKLDASQGGGDVVLTGVNAKSINLTLAPTATLTVNADPGDGKVKLTTTAGDLSVKKTDNSALTLNVAKDTELKAVGGSAKLDNVSVANTGVGKTTAIEGTTGVAVGTSVSGNGDVSLKSGDVLTANGNVSSTAGKVSLESGGGKNIALAAGSTVSAGTDANFTTAGAGVVAGAGAVTVNAGNNVNLNVAGGSFTAAAGNLALSPVGGVVGTVNDTTLTAVQDVTTGPIQASGGKNVTITAGRNVTTTGVDTSLGGGGGTVNITAVQDVTTGPIQASGGKSVTITAGRNVTATGVDTSLGGGGGAVSMTATAGNLTVGAGGITTSGGNHTGAGLNATSAGNVTLAAAAGTVDVSAGNVTANGGVAGLFGPGAGGNGGNITVNSLTATLNGLSAQGGASDTASGGAGGIVNVTVTGSGANALNVASGIATQGGSVGAGTSGSAGAGGNVTLGAANSSATVGNAINTSGGTGSAGAVGASAGGAAGNVTVSGQSATLHSVTASGGAGELAAGGAGGAVNVTVSSSTVNTILLQNGITTAGGGVLNATDALTGNAGAGGAVNLLASAGDIKVASGITTSGGSGPAADAPVSGGAGGSVALVAGGASGGKSVNVGSAINTAGGNAGIRQTTGGNSGSGGAAGNVTIAANALGSAALTGNLLVDQILAKGGNADTGSALVKQNTGDGGAGGNVVLNSAASVLFNTPAQGVQSVGGKSAAQTSQAANVPLGGSGGSVTVSGSSVTDSALLRSQGGDGSTASGTSLAGIGGSGGAVTVNHSGSGPLLANVASVGGNAGNLMENGTAGASSAFNGSGGRGGNVTVNLNGSGTLRLDGTASIVSQGGRQQLAPFTDATVAFNTLNSAQVGQGNININANNNNDITITAANQIVGSGGAQSYTVPKVGGGTKTVSVWVYDRTLSQWVQSTQGAVSVTTGGKIDVSSAQGIVSSGDVNLTSSSSASSTVLSGGAPNAIRVNGNQAITGSDILPVSSGTAGSVTLTATSGSVALNGNQAIVTSGIGANVTVNAGNAYVAGGVGTITSRDGNVIMTGQKGPIDLRVPQSVVTTSSDAARGTVTINGTGAPLGGVSSVINAVNATGSIVVNKGGGDVGSAGVTAAQAAANAASTTANNGLPAAHFTTTAGDARVTVTR